MKKDIFKKVLKEVKKQFKYTDRKNKKLIICFAGIPCSGKTYLAKRFEERYKAVRINSDKIREIINDKITKEEDKREVILEEWLLNLLKNYPYKNRLVILDSGIERKYKEISKIAKSKKWKMFIIRVIAPKNLIIKRLRIKDRERLEKHPEDLNRWFREYREFNKRIKSDFVFREDSDLERLFAKLDEIILG